MSLTAASFRRYLTRAYCPQVGDRFLNRNGKVVIEVHAVRPSKFRYKDTGRKTVVTYSHSKSGWHELFFWAYKEIVRSAIENHKLTFRAVEDDEE